MGLGVKALCVWLGRGMSDGRTVAPVQTVDGIGRIMRWGNISSW